MSCDGSSPAPAPADAKKFLDNVNETMKRLGIQQNQASWVQQTFITDDTEALNARVTQEVTDAIVRFAKESPKYDKVDVPADERRQLNLLKLSLVMVTPSDPRESEELTKITSRLKRRMARANGAPTPPRPKAV